MSRTEYLRKNRRYTGNRFAKRLNKDLFCMSQR